MCERGVKHRGPVGDTGKVTWRIHDASCETNGTSLNLVCECVPVCEFIFVLERCDRAVIGRPGDGLLPQYTMWTEETLNPAVVHTVPPSSHTLYLSLQSACWHRGVGSRFPQRLHLHVNQIANPLGWLYLDRLRGRRLSLCDCCAIVSRCSALLSCVQT